MDDIHTILEKMIQDNDVILFMKGTPVFPQCGFSATVVQVLNNVGADFKGVNVLEDENIRNGIKSYSDWPTIPQLYIKGEFIGGCDIIRELFESEDLPEEFTSRGITLNN